MPFKFHSKGRHHIPRQKYRVTNCREYEAALRNRGSLTIWFTDEAIASWKAQPRTSPGGQRHYSDLAIETALTLRGFVAWRLQGARRIRGTTGWLRDADELGLSKFAHAVERFNGYFNLSHTTSVIA